VFCLNLQGNKLLIVAVKHKKSILGISLFVMGAT
jgi:hypothetical protein